jgi:rubredoxin
MTSLNMMMHLLDLKNVGIMSYKKYQCLLCGFVYDEEIGWPEDGIDPGTRWEDVSEDWLCPDCGAMKDDFEMIEV